MSVAQLNLEHQAALIRAREPALSPEQAQARVLAANPRLYGNLIEEERTASRTFAETLPAPRAQHGARDLVRQAIDRAVVELRKAVPSLSPEAAEARVLKENPQLYARFIEATELDSRKK